MVLALSDFWEVFFLMMIWIPLVILWVASLFDIFTRPDLSGLKKALWVVFVFVIPYVGTIAYLIARPQVVRERQAESSGLGA
jgi:Phospholipase_D-nuclease N-terminal